MPMFQLVGIPRMTFGATLPKLTVFMLCHLHYWSTALAFSRCCVFSDSSNKVVRRALTAGEKSLNNLCS